MYEFDQSLRDYTLITVPKWDIYVLLCLHYIETCSRCTEEPLAVAKIRFAFEKEKKGF